MQLLQFAPIAVGLLGGYVAWRNRPLDRPISRTFVHGDTSRCIGDPARFHTNAEYMPIQPCSEPPTHKVVLVRLDRDFANNGEDVQVGLCDKHLAKAELKHAEWMEDEPRAWQSYMFPLKSPKERIYEHAKIN